MGVDCLEQIYALHLADNLGSEQLLVCLEDIQSVLLDHIADFGRLHLLEVVLVESVALLVGDDPALVILDKSRVVPVFAGAFGQIVHNRGVDRIGKHLEHGVVKILAVEYLVALAVDDLALAVENVVVLEYVLTYAEVAQLDLFLRAFDDV